MSRNSKNTKGVDLGELQQDFQGAERDYRLAEKALARAGEDRDAKKKRYEAADQALQAAVRSVRG